ncbi:hypothetical protein LQ772_06640 [Frateuria edaphi]|uniref:hypothetical protein n=1 Tax=Frateuria edaphi TaxID=2898793 RepID=UPI001E2E5E6C|nr:hypothetical protein [Frateuria edaphi]UGB46963.1 hypothetical protein LQ772_06640 [Frateuria edaphi]
MSGQTLRQRSDIEAAIAHYLAVRLRYEVERAERAEAQLHADALLVRVRAAGETCCAEPTERPLTVSEVVRVNALGLLAIAAMLAFGWLLREPMARLLVAVGVL